MTIEEAKSVIEQLKAQGYTEADVVGAFYGMFADGKLELDQFNELANLCGYHLTEEFLAMGEEEQKNVGMEEATEGEGEEPKVPTDAEAEKNANPTADVSKPDAEDSEEAPEENKEEKPAGEDEDDEEAQAMKLMKLK